MFQKVDNTKYDSLVWQALLKKIITKSNNYKDLRLHILHIYAIYILAPMSNIFTQIWE